MALTRRCTNVVQGWGSCCSRSATIVDQKVRCFRGVNRSISLHVVSSSGKTPPTDVGSQPLHIYILSYVSKLTVLPSVGVLIGAVWVRSLTRRALRA